MKEFIPHSVSNRFEALIKALGYNKNSFAKALNTNNVTIGRIINENRKPSYETLELVLQHFGNINANWLLTGEGEMFLVKTDHDQVHEAAQDDVPAEKYPSIKGLGYPLVEFRAVAGFGSGDFSISERDVKEWYVIPKFKHKKIDFMIEVEGSSMYPKYNSGDVVACKIIQGDSFIQWNKTHVIATKDQGIIIKRIKPGSTDQTLTMVSDNQQYDPFEVGLDNITGIALVIGVIRLE